MNGIIKEGFKMKCRYFEDEECDSLVINDKTCNNCLIKRQANVLADIDKRVKNIEKLLSKKTNRK